MHVRGPYGALVESRRPCFLAHMATHVCVCVHTCVCVGGWTQGAAAEGLRQQVQAVVGCAGVSGWGGLAGF